MKKRELGIILLLFACLIFFSNYVFAAPQSATISNSTGQAGIFQVYNITLNNIDATKNITQVNLTLSAPVFNFTSTPYYNTNTNATIAIYGVTSPYFTLLEFTNNSISLINNGTSGFFWFNATSNQIGTFNITVSTLDNNSVLNSTNLTITISDTIPPTISFISPTPTSGATLSTLFIPVNVTASDFGSGLKNITIYLYNSTLNLTGSSTNTSPINNAPFFYNFTGLANGIYYLNATAFDNANNSNLITTLTITINTSSSSPPCTPAWNNYTWGSCVNGNKTEIWIDSNNCNVTTGRPLAANQSCVSCTPGQWQCGDWIPAICSSNGTQTRRCTDPNNCLPAQVTNRTCVLGSAITTNSSTMQSNTSGVSSTFFIVVGIIIISIVAVVFILMKLRKKSYSTDFGNSTQPGGYSTFSPRGPPPNPPGFSNPQQVYPNNFRN